MTPPGTPRFRFRAPDGSEVPVGSVEDLSSRLEAGELGPETPLFDAGTGSWARAGDVPVFQFVLEELRAEGRLPEEMEVVVRPDPPPEEPIDPDAAFEPIRHDADTPPPLAAPSVDPFDLHLPLSNPLDPLEGGDSVRTQGAGRGSEREADMQAGPAPRPVPERGIEPEAASAPGDVDESVASGEADAPKEPWFEDRPFTEAEIEVADADADEPGEEPGGEVPRREEPPRSGRRVSTEEGEGRDPELDPDIDPSPLHAWLTHGPPTPDTAPRPGRKPVAGDTDGDLPRRPLPGRAPDPAGSGAASLHAPRTPEAGGIDGVVERDGPPLDIRTAWEDEADAEDPRAARLAARRRRRNARVVTGILAAAILLVGGTAIFNTTRSDGVATEADPFPEALAGDPTPDPALAGAAVPPPSGLEAEAPLLWRELPGHLAGVVDSLRGNAGLPDAPPRDWLSGYYLANAGEFPEVVEFWDRYRVFVEGLAERDAELAQTAARRAMEEGGRPEFDGLAGADRQRLVEYVAARHVLMRPMRSDRYLHLQRTAEAALDLHAFLVENGAFITHSPALGQGVSADPVLEAVTETPAVRREMERHLDRIFEALDRTRGGGQPSLEGLRSELFGSLGRPL